MANTLVPVELIALVEAQESSSPIVLLHDRADNLVLPIWIGEFEARSIALALESKKMRRPLTHELLVGMIKGMGGALQCAVIERLESNTYYATLRVKRDKTEIVIDARPSDAIATAVQARVPILVSRTLMKDAGTRNPFERKLSSEQVKSIAQLVKEAQKREQARSGGNKDAL